ncbi:MAG: ABC transporter ATP-binding protein [Granulosicoccus sp.]
MSLITCQALTKRYGSTLALDAVSLEIPAGEPVALIGHNGAGKTTLLSLLCGFIRPSNGSVSILGHPPGASALFGKLAALPQDALLDPRSTVQAQLRFFARLQGFDRKAAAREVQRVLHTVGLSDSAASKPEALSHGMRKRIAIAQVLIGQPAVVLLDEPTAGIDPPNAKMIRDLIKEQSQDITFIVSSHNLEELERLCVSVIYLEEGRVASFGPVVEEGSHDVLTLRLPNVDESGFIDAARQLPSVTSIVRLAQGDYQISTSDDMQSSAALMQLLHERGWRYRYLSRGKSLEERLYGQS